MKQGKGKKVDCNRSGEWEATGSWQGRNLNLLGRRSGNGREGQWKNTLLGQRGGKTEEATDWKSVRKPADKGLASSWMKSENRDTEKVGNSGKRRKGTRRDYRQS